MSVSIYVDNLVIEKYRIPGIGGKHNNESIDSWLLRNRLSLASLVLFYRYTVGNSEIQHIVIYLLVGR